MRSTFVMVHRGIGLFIALFLFIAGMTGAVISWDHELDEWLNPHLNEARAAGPGRDALILAGEIEFRHPRVQVTALPLAAEPGHAYTFWMEPRVNPASGELFEPGFNQVFVDPASGQELGKRQWGAVWPITRENFVSFLYKLHYSLHLPEMWGTDRWGIWLLGSVAMIWMLDCLVGFYLTLPAQKRIRVKTRRSSVLEISDEPAPNGPAVYAEIPTNRGSKTFWQRWKPAWKIRTGGGVHKLNFDLHRALSLWTWVLLFGIAFTAFSLNLYREVFFPVMSLVSDVTPSPFDQRIPSGMRKPIEPGIGFAEVIAKASAEAKRRGWEEPAGSVYYAREYGIYGVAFYRPEDGHGSGGVGHRELYLDGQDGHTLGDRQPWQGTLADIFVQAQFPLHSGRILGLAGRVLISSMGLVVAMLSITGVYLWWKKRKARLKSKARKRTIAQQAVTGG